MKVINLFGGPSTAKSTIASAIFSHLKFNSINCELITEVAKDMTWEESHNNLNNQIYVFGNQYHRMWRVEGKVDVAITDSPILLSLIYSKFKNAHVEKHFNMMVRHLFEDNQNLNIFLNRVNPFKEGGRVHSLEQSMEIDAKIKGMLDKYEMPYMVIDGCREGFEEYKDKILDWCL